MVFIFHLLSITAKTIGQSTTKTYSSYRPNPLCQPSEYIRYPTSVADVVSIVKEAIERNLTVKVFGSPHSQTDIICTEGIPVQNCGLQTPKQINPDNTATFGASVTVYEAAEFLKENNRAFKTIPAFASITIGGAIGTGAHGSSIKYTSSISSQVLGLTIVDGLGNIQKISFEEDLKSFRVHLALLGVVVDVTLKTHPLYKTLAHSYVVSEAVLVNGVATKWARETDQISLYWFPNFKKVVVANWTIVNLTTQGEAFTYDAIPSTYESFNIAVSRCMEKFQTLAANSLPSVSSLGYKLIHLLEGISLLSLVNQIPDIVPIYTEDGVTLKNPVVGYYNRMFASTCVDHGPESLQCLWAHGDLNANITILDNEISLALVDLPKFINSVKDILTKAPSAFPLHGILIRFSSSSSNYMSTAYGRDTVHFEFYLFNRKDRYSDASAGLAAYQTIMQTLTKTYSGRSYWGKSGLVYQSKSMIDLKLDPTARSNFTASMNKFDPNGIFRTVLERD